MKTKNILLVLFVSMMACSLLLSCDDDDDNEEEPIENNFKEIESPYLICAGRNPGGVGFDFEYLNEKGGANNIDSPSVDDFEEDIVIRTIKGEKPDGSLGGAPFFKLYDSTVEAVNYTSVDPECKGIDAFNRLNSSDLKDYTLKTDGTNFDISAVPTGDTGKPIMKDLLNEYKKLAIGIQWKSAANNDVVKDEPIWIIKTREGRLVKLMVSDFPAEPAPTAKGYVSIVWDFIN
ncbi:hypothetical protein [Marinifilum sp.]|uniref:hypothetical protein n=1 Tax=Marinifilum sp. TaxID=2033137 RepID=UPI003BAC1E21